MYVVGSETGHTGWHMSATVGMHGKYLKVFPDSMQTMVIQTSGTKTAIVRKPINTTEADTCHISLSYWLGTVHTQVKW